MKKYVELYEGSFSFLICGVALINAVWAKLGLPAWCRETAEGRVRSCTHSLFLAAGGLLGQKDCLDVGQDTTLGDGDTGEKLVELLVVPYSKLKMTGDNPGFLVVTGSVAGQLEDLSCEVLHDGSQVDWCSGTDSFSVVSFAEESVDSTDGELKTRTG